jgi:tRNA 2-selenouridine synthase
LILKHENVVTVAQIDAFDEVVDVRSPSEYAEDHLPGATSCPVLDDEQRARVGTMYTQVSTFQAKKLGAALVARNIARHLEEHFAQRERDWRPLIYCWRGGQRSGAMAQVLRQVGWHVSTLQGGYRSYRREVLVQLDSLPARLRFKVVCGATGSGKSRLLEALAAQGAQVLDLEALARHRGSVLGDLPDDPQPSQKMFDSLVWDRLRRLDPARPVFVESESRKIGVVQVHGALLERMRDAECLRIEVPTSERISFLKQEYSHFLGDPAPLKAKLGCLKDFYGGEVIGRWLSLADAGDWDALVPDLLANHYDPAYRRSTLRNFRQYDKAMPVRLERLDEEALQRAAAELADVVSLAG